MPAYSATTIPKAVYQGDTEALWSAEAIVATGKSAQVALVAPPGDWLPKPSIDLLFSGDPGVFEVDIQGADVDADADYQLEPAGQISAVDANFRARLEFAGGVKAKFLRAKMVALTNAVNVTLKVSQ